MDMTLLRFMDVRQGEKEIDTVIFSFPRLFLVEAVDALADPPIAYRLLERGAADRDNIETDKAKNVDLLPGAVSSRSPSCNASRLAASVELQVGSICPMGLEKAHPLTEI